MMTVAVLAFAMGVAVAMALDVGRMVADGYGRAVVTLCAAWLILGLALAAGGGAS